MGPRTRKLIGMFGILGFLAAYVVAVLSIADLVPEHWAVQLVFFVVVGTFWFIPILPLIKWMSREG